jgi:hypothetical protein
MKTNSFILCLMFVFSSMLMTGQKVCTIAVLSENFMYRGVVNPIAISVSDIPNNHLRIISSDSNCRIEKKDDHNYLITPKSKGMVLSLTVMNDQNGKAELIGEYKFRVKSLPPPSIALSGTKEGKIKKPVILANPYVLAFKPDYFDVAVKYKVAGVKIITKNERPISAVATGRSLSGEQIELIKGMKPGESFTLITDVVIDGFEEDGAKTIEATYFID